MSKLADLPSLNALRAFVVVGRELNLGLAAKELFVTPSALSHQIRSLEEQLGRKLFIRSRGGLSLNQDGEALLPAMTAAFAQMSHALIEFQAAPSSSALTVSMLSTFAMRWFIPRLHRFQRQHPDIEVRISTSIELVDFATDDVDYAIRSGQGEWPDTQALRLLEERFSPVCSPSLISPENPLDQPADLSQHTLLHSKMRPHDWQQWLLAEGIKDAGSGHDLEFETRNFTIAAAIRGLGVAIIDPLLVEEELKDGRLIQPFSQSLPTSSAYFLVWAKDRKETARQKAFRTWLLSEVPDKP